MIDNIETTSKIEKLFEVKPPARWAYAPEGTAPDRFLKSPQPPFEKGGQGGISRGFIRLWRITIQAGRRDRAIWHF